MSGKISHIVITALAVCMLAFSSVGHAQTIEEEPTALAMTGDALFARPALFAITVVGSVVYVVSLPFSLLGGNAAEAGETLVMGPAKATFVRCLGCTRVGRKPETVEQTSGN
jgi:hypothetical protein